MANSKKSIGTLLKASLIILLVGAVVFGVGTALTAWSHKESNFTAQQFTEANAPIEAFSIDVTTRNVDIKYADEFKVDYYNYDQSAIAVSFSGGELIVKEEVTKLPFPWFNLNWDWLKKIDKEKTTVYIYLPESIANRSKITAKTGNISVSDINFSQGFDIVSETGNVTLKNIAAAETVNLVSATGNVTLNNIAVTETVNLEFKTGNIKIDGLTSKAFKLKSQTGNFDGKNITAETVAVEVTTGSISADTMTADTVAFKTTTGKISFENLTARITDASTKTGSIDGKFTGAKSEYDITVSTTVGSSNVSNQTVGQGKSIKVKVTTGKITLNFA
ncbi:MAG: DUF4097 domain-containing protein [Clostridiales bacterium]|jgi:DUF4097 and DUF4098 domain-containing protein YvlB|nr:DUF4097 domain-containing protein [Clostridiales bacterium]